jgi:hypothetical protein
MKRLLTLACITGVLLAAPVQSAYAFRFDLMFDAGPNGITITLTKGPLSGWSETVQLTRPDDPPQALRIMPGLFVQLSIAEIAPEGKPQLTLHYVIWSGIILREDHAGDITIPFEHGYITNRWFYEEVDPGINYDVYGSMWVGMWRSRYSLNFGLSDLNGLWEAQASPRSNEIHRTITRDSGLDFADVYLAFHPRLFYTKVDFNIIMTPQSETWPSPDTAAFTGALPVPYGNYHFWFYRDSKN